MCAWAALAPSHGGFTMNHIVVIVGPCRGWRIFLRFKTT
jgi:hypothetical protein